MGKSFSSCCSPLFPSSSSFKCLLLFQASSTSHNILRCVTGRTLWKLSEIRNVYETIIDILKVKLFDLSFDYWMNILYFQKRYEFWVSVPNQTLLSNICLPLLSSQCSHFQYHECLKRLVFIKNSFFVRKLCSFGSFSLCFHENVDIKLYKYNK